MPEHPKPKNVPKVPMYPHGVKPPKMKSMLHLLHYPEEVHNTLIHKQYGIMVNIKLNYICLHLNFSVRIFNVLRCMVIILGC